MRKTPSRPRPLRCNLLFLRSRSSSFRAGPSHILLCSHVRPQIHQRLQPREEERRKSMTAPRDASPKASGGERFQKIIALKEKLCRNVLTGTPVSLVALVPAGEKLPSRSATEKTAKSGEHLRKRAETCVRAGAAGSCWSHQRARRDVRFCSRTSPLRFLYWHRGCSAPTVHQGATSPLTG